MGFGQMGAVFLTSSTTAVLAHAVLPAGGAVSAGWVGWAVCAAPANALLLVGMLVALPLALPAASRETRRRAAIRRARDAARAPRAPVAGRAGRVSRRGSGSCWASPRSRSTAIEPAWLAVLALGVLGAAGLVTADTLRGVNWSFALFFGMLASLSDVLAVTGVDRWLARLVGRRDGRPRGRAGRLRRRASRCSASC